LGIIKKSAEVNELAAKVPDNGGVYLAPAFTGLGAPHWDPYARGVVAGLTRGSTGSHLARAALESIAYQVDDLVRAMREDTGLAITELRVDGGASASDLLMQFQSDLLECAVSRNAIAETTALGAAFLAGLAVGIWEDVDGLKSLLEVERRFEPAGDPDRIAAQRRGWNAAVKRSLGWAKEVENDA
jgi:glycerol kinase